MSFSMHTNDNCSHHSLKGIFGSLSCFRNTFKMGKNQRISWYNETVNSAQFTANVEKNLDFTVLRYI